MLAASSLLLLAASGLAAAGPVKRAGSLGPIDDVLPPVVPVNTRANNQDIISQLKTAPTQEDRSRILDLEGDYVFDFATKSPPEGSAQTSGLGGRSVTADAKSMPALVGLDSAMTVAFLGPCGMNTAHVHNRATELNIVVKGRLVTNFIVENGVRPIENTMSTYQMSVFPQGAIHQEYNPDCEEAVFVASFNDEDPGVGAIAQNFFGLRPEVVEATLGGPIQFDGADIDSFRHAIPANIAFGIDACLERCHITRNAKRDLNELLMR
ncbi:RmlC-like cupin domain-containing protein [Stachybotrys elegans]|uniref:RmlC-like cupin domain-containing protein n=1 Tax=Stachybotrys elegans TaxID=80388 RepID=A0A8K0WRQ6_9HYPO|nr:RmlC-like cupin domain-containing protein [Stachybotrys elegans]